MLTVFKQKSEVTTLSFKHFHVDASI